MDFYTAQLDRSPTLRRRWFLKSQRTGLAIVKFTILRATAITDADPRRGWSAQATVSSMGQRRLVVSMALARCIEFCWEMMRRIKLLICESAHLRSPAFLSIGPRPATMEIRGHPKPMMLGF